MDAPSASVNTGAWPSSCPPQVVPIEILPQSTAPEIVVPALQAVVVVELLDDFEEEVTALLDELEDLEVLDDLDDDVVAEVLIEHSLLPPAIRPPNVSSEHTNVPFNTL